MKTYIRRGVIFILICAVLFALPVGAESAEKETETIAGEATSLDLPCRAAILMDAATGTVLYEQNADEPLPPASVTKVMTLLLVIEAVDSGKIALTDSVSVSAHAASMGGSQVYLKEGETMPVEEMIKCVVIASANDCAVALAEFVAGSEEAFVAAMNARAAELGMKNTHFENTNGLDDTVENHLISARDIAIMSRALIAHPKIFEYSGIWMDSIRDGAFGLTNTNRLVRFYRGCTGLKTGSTSRAKFCITATAERDGVSLIAVVMAADTRDIRNATAAKLLDYGFAGFETYKSEGATRVAPLTGGTKRTIPVSFASFAATVKKGEGAKIVQEVRIKEDLSAPIAAGDTVGETVYLLNGEEIGRVPITAEESVEKIGFLTLFRRMLASFFLLSA